MTRRCLSAWLLSMTAVVAGCATPPPAAGLKKTQAELLRQQGFELTDEGWTLELAGKILFASDFDKLDPHGEQVVRRIGTALLSVQIERVIVEGHTDAVGTVGYNERLALRRAGAVARVLALAGLDAAQIDVRGFGADKPVADNASPQGRSENRRVAIIVPVP